MHTTKAIADRLEVNAQTIRRWCSQYADYLSDNTRNKDALQFTDDDLVVLWSIRRWRQLGYSLDDIGDRLAAGQRVSEDMPQTADDSSSEHRAIMIPEAQFTAALAEIRRLEGERERLVIERDKALALRESERDNLTGRIEALTSELAELRGRLAVIETDRRPASYWLTRLVLAVLAAVVLVVIVAVVVLMVGR